MDALIRCRCCGEPTRTAQQKYYGGGSFTILTCMNADGKCDLCGYTFAAKDYPTIDLSAYKWREQAWNRERNR